MRKLILPVTVLLIGTGAAFATNFAKQNKAVFEGYRIDTSTPERECINMHVECSDVPTPFLCTDGSGNQLYQLEGTDCPNELYKP
ncbi:hypothetical protein CMT52_01800 [Elizabethkingia anophelis]|nr:hypothetical protein [Elizabethkingia anophelis]MDV4023065.1 hypothetical protein [Elizabethkingia anophelis]